MSPPFDASITAPQDAWEDKRLADLHPVAWANPKPMDWYQLVIVGAGSAGVAAAELAIAMGLKVAMIERHLIGGTCLNTGCVPSKALIRTARLYADMRNAGRYGGKVPDHIEVDFTAVMDRVRRIRSHLSGGSSVRRMASLGVDMFFGNVRFTGADTLMVNDLTLRFGKAMIATGTRPHIPNVPGLREAGFLTNATVFNLTELPKRLLVIGGGPVGCELAQAFRQLGSKVTIVQDKPLFLEKEERDAAQILSDAFARDGIEVRLNTTATAVRVENGVKQVDLLSADYKSTIEVDAILTGVGRVPNVQGMDLEKAGIKYDDEKGISVDDFLVTNNPRIYAAGDVCLEDQYTDTAAASARIVVNNAFMRGRMRLSELVIPWCTYTDPEIAHVGLYVREANLKGIPVKTFTVPMHQIDRAVTDSEEGGFVKIHIREGTDTILGATIVARHAGEMINEITLAMVAKIGLRTLARVIHAYPTQAEAIREAAKAYSRTRITSRLRARLQKWLARTTE
ncbi:mercuric reductase [Rhodanobacter sp. MP1X3]|uniref:mercuric reductase n=1 Tax=Rhodanobacter sp. MP1X3 TaxID=2723086 RepID=UPI0016162C5A|nr:mercuric reductase [Rhodanobacter sp. MP1X3]MBB6240795.1 pyruvate/2-oxoglutarate dehydrogenase complex dihydrolipoamide dehydrogenase (E3) component [Rhodanobacter sp. MP1X3]